MTRAIRSYCIILLALMLSACSESPQPELRSPRTGLALQYRDAVHLYLGAADRIPTRDGGVAAL